MTEQPLPAIAAPNTTDRRHWSLPRANQEPAERVFRGLGRVVHALLGALVSRRWYGSDVLAESVRGDDPATPQGIIVVSNHMSYFDALALGEYMIWSGRWPRFLGKAELWKVPVVGWLARSCGQIPVYRKSTKASEALVAAQAALEQGQAVTIFPEGTETSDPLLWPMSAHTGAARLALQGGWPVIVVAQWGAQEVMPGRRPTYPRFWPRKTITLVADGPLDVSDLQPLMGTDQETAAVRAATDRIMDRLTELVAAIRGEHPPTEGRWQHKLGSRAPSRPHLDANERNNKVDDNRVDDN